MYWIGRSGAAKDDAEGTDFYATDNDHIAITPLQVDLTDYKGLSKWQQLFAGSPLASEG